jgi:hypothetical protein
VTVQGESADAWFGQTYSGESQVSACEVATTQVVDSYGDYNEVLNSALAAPVGKPSI